MDENNKDTVIKNDNSNIETNDLTIEHQLFVCIE